MKRKLTPEQQEKSAARRDALRNMAKTISAMMPEQRQAIAAKMNIATIEGRALSPFNHCLAAIQCPGATLVGGFRQWLAAGRAVRKGEHGIGIWIPTTKANDTGGDDTRFIFGTVFDVTQTDMLEAADAECVMGIVQAHAA